MAKLFVLVEAAPGLPAQTAAAHHLLEQGKMCIRDRIWPLFGAANQMVAVPALMAAAVFLKKIGKGYKMFIVPMFFMALALSLIHISWCC